MPKILTQILIYGSLLAICAGTISISTYLYKKNNAEGQNFDSVMQAFKSNSAQQATSDAQTEMTTLQQMKSLYAAQSSLNSNIESGLAPIAQAVQTTDVFFHDPQTSPKLKLQTSPQIATQIETLRQYINEDLAALQSLIISLKVSSAPSKDLIKAADDEISSVQKYISDLQSIVDALKPDAGLTQDGIDAYIADLDSAKAIVDQSADDISQAEGSAGATHDNDQVVIPPVTQNDIQYQQNVLDSSDTGSDTGSSNASDTNSDDNSASNDAGNSDWSDSYQPPLPPPDTSGAPQLIEGANRYR